MSGGPFSSVRTLANIVLEDGCKKSPQFLNAHLNLCVLAALISAVPLGAMVKLRPELIRRLVEDLAASAGQNRERVRIAMLKKAGEVLTQLKKELGDKTPSEALLAKLTDLFIKELA